MNIYVLNFIKIFSNNTFLMVRLAVIDNLMEDYAQNREFEVDNTPYVYDSIGLVDDFESKRKPEERVVVFNVTIDTDQKEVLLKQIKDRSAKVALFFTDDERNLIKNDCTFRHIDDNSNVVNHFNSSLRAVDLNINGRTPFNANEINIILRFQPKSPSRKIVCEQNLTRREEEILFFLSKGLLYKEIAKIMSISIQTVKSHLKHIYPKLQVSNRTEAILKYLGAT